MYLPLHSTSISSQCSLLHFLNHSVTFSSPSLLPGLQCCNDNPRCGLINTPWLDNQTFDSLWEAHWRSLFHGTNRWGCSFWDGRCFHSWRNERAGVLGAGKEPLFLHAQGVCFTLRTHHISSLFIKKMVRSTGCVELERPQAKNTFTRLEFACSEMI